MDARLQQLMERMNQLGSLFPKLEDIDPDDADQMAELKIITDEFDAAKAELDAFLLAQRRKRG